MDIDLPDDPDAEIVPSPTGDLPTISGRDAVLAALRRRLLTAPGTMTHRPEYGAGLVNQVERLASPGWRSSMANAARRNILRDRRVADARVRVALGLPGKPNARDAVTVRAEVQLRGEEAREELSVHLE